ncbi:MAG TPA: sugar phosphate isomerase/epimerase [Blastocatellia bacterium]|nr:sugar phosphate isomerase/epimerase [Blastocatellia bacterium]
MINRRKFLGAAAMTAGAAYLSTTTVFAAKQKLSKFGLQLYTLRNDMAKDVAGTLANVAAAGYKEVEFAGYYNKTPQEIKDLLVKNGLTAPSTHIAINLLEKELDKTIETAKTIGHRYIVCPFLTPNLRQTLDQYKNHAALFNRVGEACKKAGIQFAYHNHDFEFVAIDGQKPMDLLLASTDPKLVQIELDLYWAVKAGEDPLALFAKHPGRFPLVHVKDMANTEKKEFTEVGRGTIDFKKIFAQSKKAGIKHYFVEQDQSAAPLESIKISAEYLKKLEF